MLQDPPNAPIDASEVSDSEPNTVAAKWQGAVGPSSGFVAVPMTLLRLQSKYGLTPTEMLVLINLLAHWWEPSSVVYPRSTTVAARMGVDKRTVQRATRKMEKLGLMTRSYLDNGRRVFDFSPLARRLARDTPLAHSVHGTESFGDD
ncbi:helix-turn-helix domain-containing protein [Altererythrobacter sp. BO-6]|nr:helix-turn-helix domain-containing protein [Altererythrobacter sp. BO-6]